MPKLPQQNKESALEVLDKKVYSTGEITFPKIPKHRIVFKHHMKLVVVLLAVVVALGLVYAAAKPMLNKQPKEEAAAKGDIDKFPAPNETNLKYPNLEYVVTITVDRIDKENKLIYGKGLSEAGKDYVLRVLDSTQITERLQRDEVVKSGSESANIKTISDVTVGSPIFVMALEDPATNTYLNVRSLEIF